MLPQGKVLELIGRFYEAALQPTLWSQSMRELTEAMGAAAGGLHIRTLVPTERVAQIWTGIAPAFENAYLQHYVAQDPWAAHIHRLEAGNIHVSRELLPEDALVRTEFYNDLCRPFGFHDWMGGIVLNRPGSQWIAVGMFGHHGRALFDEQHRAALRLLMPHLQRSIEVSRRVMEVERENEVVGEALDRLTFGVILVDVAGRVVRANRAAERILAQRDGLSVDATGLVALERHARSELRAALSQAIEGGFGDAARANVVRIPRSSGARSLAVILAPLHLETDALAELGARCIVYVIDPEHTAELPGDILRQLFKLTPAEVRLALLLGQGKVLKEAATELEISWNTARFQIRQVFAKTGSDRQATLVRLLASLNMTRSGPDAPPSRPAR